MSDLWERVDRVLARHEPSIYASLRPPASLEQIEAAESAMGLRFPVDIRTAYLHHDGASFPAAPDNFNFALDSIFVWGNSWSCLAQCIEIWKSELAAMTRLRVSDPDLFPPFDPYWDTLAIRRESWNPLRIPLGKDSGPVRTYVDLAPGGIGTNGQIISDDGAMEGVLHAPSLDAYLNVFLDLVESGVIANCSGYGWFHCESKKRVFSLLPALRMRPKVK
jgi:cell wall assembly regulator SMI1